MLNNVTQVAFGLFLFLFEMNPTFMDDTFMHKPQHPYADLDFAIRVNTTCQRIFTYLRI